MKNHLQLDVNGLENASKKVHTQYFLNKVISTIDDIPGISQHSKVSENTGYSINNFLIPTTSKQDH